MSNRPNGVSNRPNGVSGWRRTLGRLTLALSAGVAAFVLVGVGATELAAPAIEFSLFVGLPLGALAGLAAVAAVLLAFRRGTARRVRVARAAGGFGVGFLLGGLAALAAGRRPTIALGVGVLVGAAAAALTLADRGPFAAVR